MSLKANSIFTDPEIPRAPPPDLTDTTSFEEVLHFIYGIPDYAKNSRRRESVEAGWPTRRHTHPSLSRSLSGRIPFEVVELIMDIMSQGSLAYCALVCRAWHQASMRVLYRDIAISSRPAFDSLVAFAYKDARAPECFAQTVALRVDGQRDVFAHAIPLIFAPLMPHLRRLVFYTSLHPLMHPSFFNTLSLFSAVTTLELFRFKLRCFSELRQIICAFPQLKCFKVGVGVFETNLPLAPVVHPTRIRLEQLVLGWGLTPAVIIPLVRWLAGSCACATLSHLAIWRSPFNMLLQVNVLLEVAGKALLSLHEMDLHPDDDLGLEFLWPSVHQTPHTGPSSRSEIALLANSIGTHCTFAYSPNLHTIRFELRPCALDDEPREKWHLVLEELESVLRTVRSPNLRCIKIHQTTRLTGRFSRLSTRPHLFYADLEPRTLTPLHRAMTQPVFGKLTSVEFSVDVDYSAWQFLNSEGTVAMAAQKLSDGISRLLAPWNVRGLVTVVQKRNPIYYRDRHRMKLSILQVKDR